MKYRYISFAKMTSEYLRLSSEDRMDWLEQLNKLAYEHGMKILFWGNPLGVSENAVLVFESMKGPDNYIRFMGAWQEIGGENANRYIEYTRTIPVLP